MVCERRVFWDGENNENKSVTSRVYFYRLFTNTNSITNKMVFLRLISIIGDK